MDRNEFVGSIVATLDDIQQTLYDRALKLREENTRDINTLDDFKAYFTRKNESVLKSMVGSRGVTLSTVPKLIKSARSTR